MRERLRLLRRVHERWPVVSLLIPATLSVLYFWRLADYPPGVDDFDVCLNVLHTHDILSGRFTVFFMQTSREPFLYYWSAPFLWLVSDPFLGLKLGLAVAATFATIALFEGERSHSNLFGASVTVVLLSASTWYANILRSGYRAALVVTWFSILYWLWRPERPGGRRILALAAVIALGCYSYTVFWFYAPPCCLLFAMLGHGSWRARLGTLASLLGLTTALLSPLLWLIASNPDGVLARQAFRKEEIVRLGLSGSSMVRSAMGNYWTSLSAVFHDGLLNYQVQSFPVWLAPLAFLGILGFLPRIRTPKPALLTMTLLYAPLSGASMSIGFPSEVPDPPRDILLVPVVCVLCATGAEMLRSWAFGGSRRSSRPLLSAIAAAGAVVVLAVPAVMAWRHYLVASWPAARKLGTIPLYRDLASSPFNSDPAPVLVGDWDPTCLAAYGIRGRHVPIDALAVIETDSPVRIVTHPELRAEDIARIREALPTCGLAVWLRWGSAVSYAGECHPRP
jgi:hypothetical protein